MRDTICVRGARENNLKNVDVEIPRNALNVFTGLSGSGKSSLAFDTIYAEGRRRYVESLSAYVRQFLGQMDKPDVDMIEGLSPQFPSTKRPPQRILVRLSARLRRSTTISACFGRGSVRRTVRNAAGRFAVKALIRLSIRC